MKEYEYLASEVSEIRLCITRYIGYIIGSNGALFLAIKLFYEENKDIQATDPEFLFQEHNLMPFIGLIIISSLYFVVDYKFASHNRHVGYMQLLSQELNHLQITEKSKIPIGGTHKDLEKGTDTQIYQNADFDKTIMSWQYIMSRWNSRQLEDKYDENGFSKLDFRFQLPGYSYDQLSLFRDKEKGKERNVIQWFLEEIVWKPQNYYKDKRKLYTKYRVRSWQYPKYLYFISILQIIIISAFILTHVELKSMWLHAIWMFPVLLIWAYYGYNNFKAMVGDRSSDYYCWSFFAYRVQLLNNYGLRPIYFSTSFVRYFKSALLISFFKKMQNNSELERRLLEERLSGGFDSTHKRLNRELFYKEGEDFVIDKEKYNEVISRLLTKLKNGKTVNKLEKEIIRAVFNFKKSGKRTGLAR
ncbi:MAG: hypothetical protein AAGG68_12315 [Bacteroidota bacterium]